MADIRDGFKDIFLAGVGALAYGGERASELVNTLIEKGELTVEQGKELNTELQHKAADTFGQVRHDVLEAQMKAMTPEQRAQFAAKVNELADKVAAEAAAVEAAAGAAPAPAAGSEGPSEDMFSTSDAVAE